MKDLLKDVEDPVEDLRKSGLTIEEAIRRGKEIEEARALTKEKEPPNSVEAFLTQRRPTTTVDEFTEALGAF